MPMSRFPAKGWPRGRGRFGHRRSGVRTEGRGKAGGALHHDGGPCATMYHSDLMRHPDSCPALVLNADYTPLSYYPLSLWNWQTAIKAVFLQRVDIVSEYDREVRSPNFAMRLPSVIALRQYVKQSEHPAFTRFN